MDETRYKARLVASNHSGRVGVRVEFNALVTLFFAGLISCELGAKIARKCQ
mgnify:CR=1 FL=1